MKKLNLICAAIVALSATAANAGTLVAATPGGTVFAIENFGGATAAATDTIVPGTVTYSLSGITQVNAGASVYFTIRLDGAKFVAAPSPVSFQFAGQAGGTEITNVTLSTDKTTVLVQASSLNGTTLGLGAFSYTPSPVDIDNATSTLASVGGVVTATVGLTSVAPAAFELTNSLATLDAPLATTTIATSAKAIGATVSALTALPAYDGKIDLTAPVPATRFTTGSGTTVALGSFQFKDVTGAQVVRSGAGDYTVANPGNTGVTVTVTPGAGQSFPVGATLSLNANVDCTSTVASTGTGTTVFTAATALTAKTLVTTVPVATGVDRFVCLNVNGTSTIAPITATITAVVAPATTKDLIATATGSGYALDYNGTTKTFTTYFPAALSMFGYQSYIRVVNTGAVAAKVSGSFINEVTGVAGGAFAVTGTIAPGASVVVTGAALESVLGAPGAGDRPRLRLTAPTNGLEVQYFFQDAAGAINEISSNR